MKKNTDTPVVYYIVGNKTDLIDTRTIMYEEAKEFAASVDAHYWETSVYSNSGNILSSFFSNVKSCLSMTMNLSLPSFLYYKT